jgi:1-acyl-sn-glycerol-3-phosphate acyltransferase
VTIPRVAGAGEAMRMMQVALDEGDSLIVFPEGTRNMTEQPLLPFRNGIFWLASSRPAVDCVPVWIANLNRVLPKGEFLPVPLLCSVTFGAPIHVGEGETREDFVVRARSALLALSPQRVREASSAA